MKYILQILFFFFSIYVSSQQTKYVDFKTGDVQVTIDASAKEVLGKVIYSYQVLKDVDTIFMDAINFNDIRIGNSKEIINFFYDGKKIAIIKSHKKSNFIHDVAIEWKVAPKKAMYFIDWNNGGENQQVWTQGQGKYTSNWLPSIDDMNDKIEFDLSITFGKGYEVITNGKLVNKQTNDSTATWYYDMQQPMSSYLVALAIGNYSKRVTYSKSGIPIELYYYPEDSIKAEPTYRYTAQIFDFLEEEIGVPYPWQTYKQVPVKDFLYAGMENTSTTIFSDSFVIDSISFLDKNYVNVNAHELAHQWFGDLVTETSGSHHWLQEGFATYYALLAEKTVFGVDYFYWQLYNYAQELLEQDKAGESTSLLDPKSSSITFYEKGAWVLYLLREQVGNKAFSKGVKNYLSKHQFKNVETSDFIFEIEKTSGQDLSLFLKDYLESDTLPYEEMIGLLKTNSVMIKNYFDVNYNADDTSLSDMLSSNILDEAKIKIINQNPHIIKKEHFNNSLKVRQAIAKSLSKIPVDLKEDYESLLNDKSYLTMEAALLSLCFNFPEESLKYLNKTKGIDGFNDKSLRIVWLTLALIHEGFEPENKTLYFKELIDYTGSKFGFEIRQNAFMYLQQIKACNNACVENLRNATEHHHWQFAKFAKSLLETINKN